MAFSGTKKTQASKVEPVQVENLDSQQDDVSPIDNFVRNTTSPSSNAFVVPKVQNAVDDLSAGLNEDFENKAQESQEERVMPEFLKPKKDVVKDSMNDPYKEEVTIKTAYHITLKTLNALKIVSPIIAALMQRPGVDAPNEEMSSSFRKLIQETSDISAKFCERLEVDPEKQKNYWIRNVLEKHFAKLFKEQWVTKGDIDVKSLEVFIDEVIKISDRFEEKTEFTDFDEITTVRLGMVKAMTKVLNEAQTNFNLYRNLEEDIEPIMEKLYNLSVSTVDKLADDYAQPKDKAKLFDMVIQEAGELYAGSWRAEAKRTQEIIKNTPKEKLEKVLEKYKSNGGLPLDKVNHDFDKYFNKMVVITEKLIFSQQGTLQKRLKTKIN